MIVFAADLHLSPTIWADMSNVRGDSYAALKEIASICVKEKADALILGGDIFDKSTPDSLSVAIFQKEMDRVLKAGTRVLGIQGQHDRSDPPWFELVPTIHSLSNYGPLTLEIDGHRRLITGFDNTDAVTVEERLKELPECNILVMHQAMQEVLSLEGQWNLKEEWIPDFVELVLLGDLHTEAQVGKCYYSGSTHIRSISENPDKSVITVSCKKDKLVVKRRALHGRLVNIATVGDDEGLVMTLSLIEELPDDALLIARVAPNVKGAYHQLREKAKEHNVHIRIRDLPVVQEEKSAGNSQTRAATLDGALGSVVDKNEKPKLYKLLSRLLNATDPEEELAAIKSEFGITS